MTKFGNISEIWRYPISSTGGERLQDAHLGPRGLPLDRSWGIVDLRNGDVAGPEKRRHWRAVPNLSSALIDGHPHLRKGDGAWLPAGSAEADALITRFLGFDAALRAHCAFGSVQDAHVAPRYERADLHVLTSASMRHLVELVGDADEIDSRRFRPNIVIETAAGIEGFAEHILVGQRLIVGDAVLEIVEPCARCAFTALAQANLAFRPDVLHQIAQHGEGGFGVLCKVGKAGHIRIGDGVTVTT